MSRYSRSMNAPKKLRYQDEVMGFELRKIPECLLTPIRIRSKQPESQKASSQDSSSNSFCSVSKICDPRKDKVSPPLNKSKTTTEKYNTASILQKKKALCREEAVQERRLIPYVGRGVMCKIKTASSEEPQKEGMPMKSSISQLVPTSMTDLALATNEPEVLVQATEFEFSSNETEVNNQLEEAKPRSVELDEVTNKQGMVEHENTSNTKAAIESETQSSSNCSVEISKHVKSLVKKKSKQERSEDQRILLFENKTYTSAVFESQQLMNYLSKAASEQESGDLITLAKELKSRVEEVYDEPPALEEVKEFASYLGMDLAKDENFFFIAQRAMTAPIPIPWTVHLDPSGNEYFYNSETRVSQFEHPMDAKYKELYMKLKEQEISAL